MSSCSLDPVLRLGTSIMSLLAKTAHSQHLEMRTAPECVRSLCVEHDVGLVHVLSTVASHAAQVPFLHLENKCCDTWAGNWPTFRHTKQEIICCTSCFPKQVSINSVPLWSAKAGLHSKIFLLIIRSTNKICNIFKTFNVIFWALFFLWGASALQKFWRCFHE